MASVTVQTVIILDLSNDVRFDIDCMCGLADNSMIKIHADTKTAQQFYDNIAKA